MTVEFTQEVSDRLSSDNYGWLTTVAKSGQPVPRLVWFYFDGTDVIVYSEPNAAKVRHIKAHPRVSLNLDSDGNGAGIIVVGGDTSVDAEDADPLTDERYRGEVRRVRGQPWIQRGVPRRLQHPAEDQHRQGLDHADRRLVSASVRVCPSTRREFASIWAARLELDRRCAKCAAMRACRRTNDALLASRRSSGSRGFGMTPAC